MERIIYLKVLSVLSCFAVVALHMNGCFWTFNYGKNWILANIIESVMYFAVPVFFMISGATLIDYRKRYNTFTFFEKRFVKTGIPFVIWSVIGIIWRYFEGGFVFDGFRSAIGKFLNTGYIGIYWFFIPLFAIYFSIPFISGISEDSRKQIFGYGIIAAFLLNSFLPFVFKLLRINNNPNFNIPAVSGYLIYVLLGYWLSHYELEKKYRIIIYILAIIGLMAHIFGTMYLSYKAGEIVQTFKGYTNVPCILYSTGVFLFFKNIRKEKLLFFLDKITSPFADLTLGIYLTHWFVINIILKCLSIPTTNIIYRTFGTVVVFLICSAIVKLLKCIPVIKKAVP